MWFRKWTGFALLAVGVMLARPVGIFAVFIPSDSLTVFGKTEMIEEKAKGVDVPSKVSIKVPNGVKLPDAVKFVSFFEPDGKLSDKLLSDPFTGRIVMQSDNASPLENNIFGFLEGPDGLRKDLSSFFGQKAGTIVAFSDGEPFPPSKQSDFLMAFGTKMEIKEVNAKDSPDSVSIPAPANVKLRAFVEVQFFEPDGAKSDEIFSNGKSIFLRSDPNRFFEDRFGFIEGTNGLTKDLSRIFGQPDGKIIASSDGNPSPEPSSLTLLSLGSLGLLGYGQRRRKRAAA
jgi:hypothetical protein